ncbi:MAG: bifunctional alpha,alpha-trehalose-phosphate synthase (UDP-forming)/trehalose-phosphatase [Actinomycetota bacterium]|nr:bifunctional alpha,alpha-trehalose-phosphate synthase (UDP-forming)/trehalose-phosphatase [Actinomycetota bacterium]
MIVVANRLPFDLKTLADGSTEAKQAPGGLVTALAPILAKREGAWIGWAGDADADLHPTTTSGLTLHPVPLSADEISAYYEGFSNSTLWPLYHDAVADPEYHRHWWDSYQHVNKRFAEKAAAVAGPGAIVWIHDYQLLLVPQLLRDLRPDVRIGFFQHIPFPPVELYMRLPWRKEIITGMLGADLIGFQVPGAVRNFLRLARTLAGAEVTGSILHFDGRSIRAGAFPISIDSKNQSELAARPEVTETAATLRSDLGNPRKIILGVDRLDYTKGINVRLRAFSELLNEGDPADDGVVMVQIATPSRERVGSYMRMRAEIEQQVGALNGDYGRIGHPAVHYLHQSFPREELAAFYVAADVMAVTPLRDGMNLVAKEYVACRSAGDGVLLLSEFTGAAGELHQALLVNPYDTNGVKEALRTALQMPRTEQRKRMRTLRQQVLTNDVDAWAKTFLSTLEDTKDPVAAALGRLPDEVVSAVRRLAEEPYLLVGTDFDGVLAPIVDDPAAARPLSASVDALRTLAVLPNTSVAVISGRSLEQLRNLLGEAGPLHLIGSHGAEDAGIAGLVKSLTLDDPAPPTITEAEAALMKRIEAAVGELALRFPSIRLEPKPAGIAIHLRGAPGQVEDDVTAEVTSGIATWEGVYLLRGKKVLELTVVTANKGKALAGLRQTLGSTATIFIGDDVTDEHAFRILDSSDIGVKVGAGESAATLRIATPQQAADLLTALAAARRQQATLFQH